MVVLIASLIIVTVLVASLLLELISIISVVISNSGRATNTVNNSETTTSDTTTRSVAAISCGIITSSYLEANSTATITTIGSGARLLLIYFTNTYQ